MSVQIEIRVPTRQSPEFQAFIDGLADHVGDAIQEMSDAMIYTTCVAYLCMEHKEAVGTGAFDIGKREIGGLIAEAFEAAFTEAKAVITEAREPTDLTLAVAMRKIMFVVRASAEQYIRENDLERAPPT